MEDNPVQPSEIQDQSQPLPPVPESLQNPQPPTPPEGESPKPSRNNARIIIGGILFLIILIFFVSATIFASYKLYNRGYLNNIPNTTSIKNLAEDDKSNIPSVNAGKRKFTNIYLKYSIDFPSNYSFSCDEGRECSIGIDDGTSKLGESFSGGGGQITIIPINLYNEFVSRVVEDHANGAEYYDAGSLSDLRQEKEFYDSLLTAADKGEKIVFDQENYIDVLPDIKIGTISSKVLKSSIDSFYGSYDKYFIVETGGETFLIIGYIDENASEKNIDRIAQSFKIIDSSVTDKINDDLTKELGSDVKKIEIRFIFDNYAEGIAYVPLVDEDGFEYEIFREDNRFYVKNENGNWKIIVNENDYDVFEVQGEVYDWCVEKLANIDNLPVEVNCFFNSYPLYLEDIDDFSDLY